MNHDTVEQAQRVFAKVVEDGTVTCRCRWWKENDMADADGYGIPLPKADVEGCRRRAGKCGAIWREYGAGALD
jgi:hypothetical protein